MDTPVSVKHRAAQVGLQLIVLSVLTLITVAAFTHIATMLLFRRLVIGRRKPEPVVNQPTDSSEDFFVPLRSTLSNAATVDHETASASVLQRASGLAQRAWAVVNDLPSSLRELLPESKVTREIFVRCIRHYPARGNGKVLLLCNPSGETVDTLAAKATMLSQEIGFDTLILFDYRPTGRSCKGLIAPDTRTMLEDAESVIQWLISVKEIDEKAISLAGISLGGMQAMRLALRHREVPRLILINTFSSFSCLLRNSASLLPGALRIGGTSAFLPDISRELHSLTTPIIAVISVENDERIPTRCTDEMISALQHCESSRLLHVVMQGTHSNPKVDYNSLETIRLFLQLSADFNSAND